MKLLLLLVFFISAGYYAQIDQVKRIEFELYEDFSSHDLSKFGENGILVYSKYSNANKWKVEHYTTGLVSDKSIDFEVPVGQMLNDQYENKRYLFLFFKSRRGEFTLIKIDSKNLIVETHKGVLPKKSNVLKINANDDFLYLSVALKKERMIYMMNLRSDELRVHPLLILGYKTGNIKIESSQIINNTNDFFVYVNAYTKKDVDVYVFRFDENGDKVGSFKISEGLEENITSISASRVGKDEYLFTGTYSLKSSSASEGLYICKTDHEKVEFIKFYNFLNLSNFLSYLPEKRQEKIEKKRVRKASKGKTYAINYFIAAHDIIVRDDKYIFIGEAYYPTYRTTTTYTMGANGQMIPQTYTVFDGYRYTHATIAAFNKSGDLLWDQSFKLYPDYKPFYVKRFISVSTETENRINMLFASSNSIYAKSFDMEGNVVSDKSYESVSTSDESDIVKRSMTNLDYWYDKYFLAHGEQKIKNKENEDKKKKRIVYFISKIGYK